MLDDCRVWGLGFWDLGVRFRVWGLGLRILGFRDLGLGFRVRGLGFRVRFRVKGCKVQGSVLGFRVLRICFGCRDLFGNYGLVRELRDL